MLTYNEWIKNVRDNPNSQLYPERLTRCQPDTLNISELMSQSRTSDLKGLSEFQYLGRTTTGITLSGQSTLKEVDLPYLSTISGNLDFHSCTLLSTLDAPELQCPVSQTINFTGCALTQASVDALIANFAESIADNPTTYTSTIDLNGGTNAIPSDGVALYAVTLAGVTVNTN